MSTNFDLPELDPVKIREWGEWLFLISTDECYLDAFWLRKHLIREAERNEMMGIEDCPKPAGNFEQRITNLEQRVTELEKLLEDAVTAAMEKYDGKSFNTAFETPPTSDIESVPVPVCPEHPDSVVSENGCTQPGCAWSNDG